MKRFTRSVTINYETLTGLFNGDSNSQVFISEFNSNGEKLISIQVGEFVHRDSSGNPKGIIQPGSCITLALLDPSGNEITYTTVGKTSGATPFTVGDNRQNITISPESRLEIVIESVAGFVIKSVQFASDTATAAGDLIDINVMLTFESN